jgi:hypothetical protein
MAMTFLKAEGNLDSTEEGTRWRRVLEDETRSGQMETRVRTAITRETKGSDQVQPKKKERTKEKETWGG